MRELYAAEIVGDDSCNNAAGWELISTWAERHLTATIDGEPREVSAEVPTFEVEDASDGSKLAVLQQPDDGDSSLTWRSEIGIGPPADPLEVTIRVRLAATGSAAIAPIEYEFATPAIVRTILRQAVVVDAGQRVQPGSVELGSSDIPALVVWLEDPARRLPVVLVSRTRDTGATLIDANALAKELSGIGHVRVLSSSQAAWSLTEVVGPSLSIWDGAVRIYFPGFANADEPRRHRYWVADRVGNELIGRVRSWLGTLSASRTGEHAVHARLRSDRRERLLEATGTADTAYITEYIELLEATEKQRQQQVDELQRQIAELERRFEAKAEETEDIRREWGAFSRSQARAAPTPTSSAVESGELTVAGAMDAVEELLRNAHYAGKVEIAPQAIAAGRAFASYNRPEQLLTAVQSVIECGALYNGNLLGEPPKDFFQRRGFGYAAQPAPHLKVDEATSPDQCLRIYWEVDEGRRLWTLTSIGRHER